ncbi:DUF4179 domain-containing protein [Clostridium sp.]
MKCDEIRQSFMDYLDGSLTAEEEKNLINHLEVCTECREELAELKRLVNKIDISFDDINVPEDFMKNIRARASIIDFKGAKRKRRPLRVLLIAAVILTMSVLTVFAARNPIMELIKRISPESRINNIVDKGMGDRLNISKIDKNIKITITDVVADDIQTLISFKIEDLKSGKEYRVKYDDGIDIKERWGAQIKDTTIKMYNSVFSTEGKGMLTLYPIDTDKKTINLAFIRLETKLSDTKEVIEGNWDFEIPIKKNIGKSYDIKASVKVDDYIIFFNRINISPTLTTLYFNHSSGYNRNEEILGLEDMRIIANGKEYKPYNYGNGDWNPYSTIGYGDTQMTFDSMYFDNPKDIQIKLSRISIRITEEKPKEFVVNLDEASPQEFEYLGTKLYIDNLKVGEDITFDLKQPIFSKKLETLSTQFWPANEHSSEKSFSTGGNFDEVYYIDKDDNKYEYLDALLKWDEIREKKPVMYIANTSWKLHPVDGFDIKKEKSIRMVIDGYSKTKFVDEVVKVKLK